jgi:hypothetical protein
MESGKKCSVVGCHKIVLARGLCDMHRKRLDRHGHTEQTRPSDWGAREKHPLYKTWAWMLRSRPNDICARWRSFWPFVEDVGNSRPSKRHRPARSDLSQPFSSSNFYWREPVTNAKSPEARGLAAASLRAWRFANSETWRNAQFVKTFGITLADYEAMMVAQAGVCAICSQPETRIDNRTKQPSRLAVDHCHSTGKVRGLLCSACNKGIGHLKDDPALLRKAADYLER